MGSGNLQQTSRRTTKSKEEVKRRRHTPIPDVGWPGLLVKPSRQTYAAAEVAAIAVASEEAPVDVSDETVPVATAADAQIDPLA